MRPARGRTEIRVETKGERDDGGDAEEDEDLVLEGEPHEEEEAVGLALGQRVVAEYADAVLFGGVDKVGVSVGGFCGGGCALDVVVGGAGLDGLDAAEVETAVLVCAEGCEDALDTAHVAELLYALWVEEVGELDGTEGEGARVDVALTLLFGSERLGLSLTSAGACGALEGRLDAAEEALRSLIGLVLNGCGLGGDFDVLFGGGRHVG